VEDRAFDAMNVTCQNIMIKVVTKSVFAQSNCRLETTEKKPIIHPNLRKTI